MAQPLTPLLRLDTTKRFHVLTAASAPQHCRPPDGPSSSPLPASNALPVVKLTDLLLHRHRDDISTEAVSRRLWSALESFGFVVLSVPPDSEAGRVAADLRDAVQEDFFPDGDGDGDEADDANGDGLPSSRSHDEDRPARRRRNAANLRSGETYLSERGVPMWNLGYEMCDDIREAFRVHAGSPDSQPWPAGEGDGSAASKPRRRWLRGMTLCRHICDEALSLTLGYDPKSRAGSGLRSWNGGSAPYYSLPDHSLPDRRGDYSVMYAMHYFNDDRSTDARNAGGKVTGSDDPTINVKEHVDPSLFVLEPFLADEPGLQVKPAPENTVGWITCDGPSSLAHAAVDAGARAMVLFVGRAFEAKSQEITGRVVKATLHRVVAGGKTSRRTVIYEQKYEEYFPPPALD